MNAHAITRPRWTTSSFGDTRDLPDQEASALREHLGECHGLRGRWFTLHCIGETLDTFLSGRFVTTLVLATALIGASVLVG